MTGARDGELTDDAAEPQEKKGPTWREFASHIGTVAIGLPIAATCIRILSLTYGDPVAVSAIVTYLDAKTIILATTIPLFSTLAYPVTVWYAIYLLRSRAERWPGVTILIISTPFMLLTLVPSFAIAAAGIVIVIMITRVSDEESPLRRIDIYFNRFMTRVAIILLGTLTVFFFAFGARPPVPAEDITTRDNRHHVVYVLKESDDAVVVVYQRSKVARIPTNTIKKRIICDDSVGHSVFNLTLIGLIAGSGSETPSCPR